MTVDEGYHQKVLSGEIKLKISVNTILDDSETLDGIKFALYNVEIPMDTIQQLERKNLLKELIKFLYIFDRNRLELRDWALD